MREGRVNVLAKLSGGSFDLEAGQALDLPKSGGALPSVRSALPEELQAMQQADTIRTAA